MSALDIKLHELLQTIDDEHLQNVDDEEIVELRKKINPYGRTIQGSDEYLNFSVTLIRDEYLKKLQLTAMVGFLFRMCNEWKVPQSVPVVPVDEYLQDKSKVDMPEKLNRKENARLIEDYEFNKKWMEKRVAVYEFLEEFFQFNPDEHVRSAYYPNRADKTRKPIATNAAIAAIEHLKNTDKDFRAKEAKHELEADHDAYVKKVVKFRDAKGKIKHKTIKVLKSTVPEPTAEEKATKTNGGKDPTCATTAREYIPPHDTFGRFNRYLRDNYEEIRDAVADLYCEKPDFELAINPYSWHKTEDEAEAFKKKHADEVISEVFTAHSGKWNFFDSFKKQRENTNFFTKDTIVLEEMLRQHERDQKLGREMMNKRKTLARKKNEIEDGPHAASFELWKKNNPHLQKLAAVGDRSDPDIMDENLLEVQIWNAAKGGLELAKHKIHIQAEAPTFASEAAVKAFKPEEKDDNKQ